MLRRFLGLCLLIISFMFCTLSSMALKSPPILEYNSSYEGFKNLSKPILREEDNQGDGRVQNHVMKLETSEKGKSKGTGVYGGGNIAHRPRPHKNAADRLPPATTLITVNMIITHLQLVHGLVNPCTVLGFFVQ